MIAHEGEGTIQVRTDGDAGGDASALRASLDRISALEAAMEERSEEITVDRLVVTSAIEGWLDLQPGDDHYNDLYGDDLAVVDENFAVTDNCDLAVVEWWLPAPDQPPRRAARRPSRRPRIDPFGDDHEVGPPGWLYESRGVSLAGKAQA